MLNIKLKGRIVEDSLVKKHERGPVTMFSVAINKPDGKTVRTHCAFFLDETSQALWQHLIKGQEIFLELSSKKEDKINISGKYFFCVQSIEIPRKVRNQVIMVE